MNVFAMRAAELAQARPELGAAAEPLLKAREAVRLPGRVVRKSLGLTLASEKTGEERIYRLAAKGKAAKRKE
jgi:hypothetical protein